MFTMWDVKLACFVKVRFNSRRPGLLEKIACYGRDDPYVLVIRNKFGGCDSALLYR